MLIVFDKDGTLVADVAGRPPNAISEQKLLPGVAEKCAELRAQGHTLAVASNQGGVAYGYMSFAEAELIVAHAAGLIGAELAQMCPYHPKGTVEPWNREAACRKPNPGMLLSIMEKAGFGPEDTLYVGDWGTDEQAAEAAGVRFEWASKFFGITLKFFYTADFVYDSWLLPEERVGLDIIATLARFEQQAKIAVGNWAHVKAIECHRVEEPGLAFRFEPADDRAVPAMGRGIIDMDINKHWLVYETPEAHARALWNTRAINLRLTLASDMMSAYNISYQEAKSLIDLIERAKNDPT
jgi:D-glycero-D-manno-heptose 1,7-bisphosphate phosphatase